MNKTVRVLVLGSFSGLLRGEIEKMRNDKPEEPKCYTETSYHGSVIPCFSERERLQSRLTFLAGCC